MKKLLLIVIAGLLLSGCATGNRTAGGDKDTRGCIGSAGYTWCPQLGKCVRIWEEPCVDRAENSK